MAQEEQEDLSCRLKVVFTWSISESPGKSGLLVTISAKMQPRLQLSTEAE